MRVKLLQPHTHRGREYPVGTELDLRQDRAEWLIAIKKAQAAQPAADKPAGKKE
ncbi:DUF7210 family protein [Pseudothauera rhizosphaerae]|uniref:DUF7210 family protein n=1 Tax=Pseudothauera rhizosphaerae TaxID=2565932 RepID=UPI001454DD2D|nr:hypothetical protein [Pseudothauera rhizosphaerae]